MNPGALLIFFLGGAGTGGIGGTPRVIVLIASQATVLTLNAST